MSYVIDENQSKNVLRNISEKIRKSPNPKNPSPKNPKKFRKSQEVWLVLIKHLKLIRVQLQSAWMLKPAGLITISYCVHISKLHCFLWAFTRIFTSGIMRSQTKCYLSCSAIAMTTAVLFSLTAASRILSFLLFQVISDFGLDRSKFTTGA